MRLLASLLISLMACTVLPAAAYEIAGVDIPDSIELADSDSGLLLNGAGIREKFFLDIYVGALYLPSRTSDADAILAGSGPASVLMHFLYSEVSRQKITEGWRDGLRANITADEMQAIQAALDKFNTLFLDVRKGDVIRIDYRPPSGTAVRINGEWRGSVADKTFFRSLLKVWLGTKPVSRSLKKAMLGVKD
jgi:hypothetical protein